MPKTHFVASHRSEQARASRPASIEEMIRRPDLALLDAIQHLEMNRFFQADPKTVEPETTLALATLRQAYVQVKDTMRRF